MVMEKDFHSHNRKPLQNTNRWFVEDGYVGKFPMPQQQTITNINRFFVNRQVKPPISTNALGTYLWKASTMEHGHEERLALPQQQTFTKIQIEFGEYAYLQPNIFKCI